VTEASITPEMTMEEILRRFPAAQRALFQRYHVGGCSSCGFLPSDPLSKVCKDHNILDVNEVISHLLRAQELDDRMQVGPAEVQGWQQTGEDFDLIDVRQPDEIAQAALPGAQPLDFQDQERYMALPKDRRIVFACKDGGRSLDVAAYFLGHGFTNVMSLRGGLDAWRAELDPSLPTY
jgi:rhodanese-related sulfurtransferase